MLSEICLSSIDTIFPSLHFPYKYNITEYDAKYTCHVFNKYYEFNVSTMVKRRGKIIGGGKSFPKIFGFCSRL